MSQCAQYCDMMGTQIFWSLDRKFSSFFKAAVALLLPFLFVFFSLSLFCFDQAGSFSTITSSFNMIQIFHSFRFLANSIQLSN